MYNALLCKLGAGGGALAQQVWGARNRTWQCHSKSSACSIQQGWQSTYGRAHTQHNSGLELYQGVALTLPHLAKAARAEKRAAGTATTLAGIARPRNWCPHLKLSATRKRLSQQRICQVHNTLCVRTGRVNGCVAPRHSSPGTCPAPLSKSGTRTGKHSRGMAHGTCVWRR